MTVGDDEILAARAELATEGLYVEPTSAVCWAAVGAAGTVSFPGMWSSRCAEPG